VPASGCGYEGGGGYREWVGGGSGGVIVEREEKGHGEMLGRVTIYPSKQCHY